MNLGENLNSLMQCKHFLHALIGDSYRVRTAGSTLALGVRDAFHGSSRNFR